MPQTEFLSPTDSGFVDAWIAASTGEEGWWQTQYPDDHFRTSLFSPDLLASLVVALLAEWHLDSHSPVRVLDLGAGGGQLASAIAALRPRWSITAVDVRPAPKTVSVPWLVDTWDIRQHRWTSGAVDYWWTTGPSTSTVVIGHEFLDELPCAFGAQHDPEWAHQWWPNPQHPTLPEIGRSRDIAWADVISRLKGPGGYAIAVDYGHFRQSRPARPTLRGFRDGVVTAPRIDGSVNLTADVAWDAVAAAAAAAGGEEVWSADQATTVARWLATPSSPRGPLAELVARNQRQVLQAPRIGSGRGFGAYWWLIHRVRSNVAG